MKIKTSELEGVALDWAVAKAIGRIDQNPEYWFDEDGEPMILWLSDSGEKIGWEGMRENWNPSIDWSQCGPLLTENPCDIEWYGVDGKALGWFATCDSGSGDRFVGHTCQQAICRAIVAAELGEEIDISDELVNQ